MRPPIATLFALLLTLAPFGCQREPPPAPAIPASTEPVAVAAPAPPPPPRSSPPPRPLTRADLPPGPTRVAILNFGPPTEWGSEVADIVGVGTTADAWHHAAELLARDRVQVVVVRVNSGAGFEEEVPKFHEVFQRDFLPRFYTVAWIESAISSAALATYAIPDMYFMPTGMLGAALGWPQGQNVAGMLSMMEAVSDVTGRSRAIVRSMQIPVPLSVSSNEHAGEIKWFQDTTGTHVLNPEGQIYTLTAHEAVQFKFAKGIAADRNTLVQAMGLHDVVWAGEEAAQFLDRTMRDADETDQRCRLLLREFGFQTNSIDQTDDTTERRMRADKAAAKLDDLESLISAHPAFSHAYGLDAHWFADRREQVFEQLMR